LLPALARARKAIRELPLADGATVLVAFSGGQDSLALLAAAAFVAKHKSWQLRAVTVDHQLRAHSDVDARDAIALANQLGVKGEIHTVQVPGGTQGRGHGGPEAAARTARYRALSRAAHHHHADAVLLGHTQDDQAEGVLLALARGAGARSLAGMRAQVGIWYRPLLSLTRAETALICQTLHLQPVIDPSNALSGPWRAADGSALKRIALRERVMPLLTDILGPGVTAALARTATQLRRDDDALRTLAIAARNSALVYQDKAKVWLRRTGLQPLHAAVRTRVLHMCAQQLATSQVLAVQVADMDRLVMDNAVRGPVYCADAVTVCRDDGLIKFQGRNNNKGERRGRSRYGQ
ncbi:MAG: tRNA lysidine(34) synthetase TilS, partial [Bowdeniella nasicola]|nr:tRNA lysidine(34) synthetase TilS [Bowdeniella nasicola]